MSIQTLLTLNVSKWAYMILHATSWNQTLIVYFLYNGEWGKTTHRKQVTVKVTFLPTSGRRLHSQSAWQLADHPSVVRMESTNTNPIPTILNITNNDPAVSKGVFHLAAKGLENMKRVPHNFVACSVILHPGTFTVCIYHHSRGQTVRSVLLLVCYWTFRFWHVRNTFVRMKSPFLPVKFPRWFVLVGWTPPLLITLVGVILVGKIHRFLSSTWVSMDVGHPFFDPHDTPCLSEVQQLLLALRLARLGLGVLFPTRFNIPIWV